MEVGSFKILFFRGEKFPIQNSREPIGLFINVSVIAFPEVNTLGYMIYLTKKMFNLDGDRICTWHQGVFFLAGPESQECCVFISDVVIRDMYIAYTWRAQNANINKTFFCQSKFTIDSDIGIMTIMLT